MKKETEPSIELLRHQLASIDLSDVKETEEISETDRRAYCAAIFAVFPRIEKDMKKFLYDQLMFGMNQAQTWEQVIFARGTYNGIALLLEHWKKSANEHEVKSKEEGLTFDKNNPLPEL